MTHNTEDFDYELPEALIAQTPSEKREESRLLIPGVKPQIVPFQDIRHHLNEGDVLVLNTSRVMKARLRAECERARRSFEMLMVSPLSETVWEAMIQDVKRLQEGDTLAIDNASLILKKKKGYLNEVEISGGLSVWELMEKCGSVPLPPYIRRPENPTLEDETRYQTVFSEQQGSSAAPTAGLHFSQALLDSLRKKGVTWVPVVLHVGPGTFLPVTAKTPEEHRMHREWIEMPESSAQALNDAKKQGKRITAVGTTALRVLESVFHEGEFRPYQGGTELFVYPPRKVLSANRLLTNFHQPKSTLLMLVSAFAGLENIRKIYQFAIQSRMRFLSYGDAMLLENENVSRRA